MDNRKRFKFRIIPYFISAALLIMAFSSYIFCPQGLWTIGYILTVLMIASIVIGFIVLLYEGLCDKRPLLIPDPFEVRNEEEMESRDVKLF
jgi:hypothetical protein